MAPLYFDCLTDNSKLALSKEPIQSHQDPFGETISMWSSQQSDIFCLSRLEISKRYGLQLQQDDTRGLGSYRCYNTSFVESSI